MRARIATVALLGIAALGVGPALAAEECSVAETILEQCPPAPPPTPEPTPEPQPEAQPQPSPQPSFAPGHQSAAVSRLLVLLNVDRQQRGLPAFTLRDDVSAQSRKHSEAMAAGGTIWHNDAYFATANKRRLGAAFLGENVARNVDIDDAHRRLMNSPGHKANIVDKRFTVIGLGVYRSTTGSLYVTESFVQPVAGAPARVAEQPRAVPVPAAAPTTTVPAVAVVVADGDLVSGFADFGGAELPAVLSAPTGLTTPAGGRSPLTMLVAMALLAAVGAALFAPLVCRFRR